MYQNEPVLVDVDMDFLLDSDYPHHLNPGCHDEADLFLSGREFGTILSDFLKPSTQVRLVVDHHESLHIWDKENITDALCIHIDAHHDMWVNDLYQDESPDYNRETVDCGSYLNQAMADEIVDRIVYVPSPWRRVNDERDSIAEEIPAEWREKVSVRSWDIFLAHQYRMPKADILTIAISPEWMPKKYWREILHTCEALGMEFHSIMSKIEQADKRWAEIYVQNWSQPFEFPYQGSANRKKVANVSMY